MDDKLLKAELDKINSRLDKLENQRIGNIVNGVERVPLDTVNSGDTTTDTVINSIRTSLNKIITNAEGQ